MTADVLLFNLIRRKKREWSRDQSAKLTQAEVDEANAVIRDWKRANGIETATQPPETGRQPAGGAAGGAPEPSEAAFALIREFEGYAKAQPDGSVVAYPDPASGGDPWTIGFGSTGADVRRGTHWTRAQAEARLASDVREFAAGVARAIGGAATTQHEFDALVSFAYNVGLHALEGSTLLRKHKAGDKAGAAAEFGKWVYASGKRMAGLVRRRAAEAEMYRGAR